jgi:hypothetical protein
MLATKRWPLIPISYYLITECFEIGSALRISSGTSLLKKGHIGYHTCLYSYSTELHRRFT